MAQIKKILLYIFCVIGVYFFAFNPIFLPFSSIGLVKLTYPLLLLYLVGGDNYKDNFKKFWSITKIYVIAVVYCLFLSLLYGTNIGYTRLVNLIEIFLIPICVATLFVKRNINLPLVLFLVASVAAIISFVAFVNPSFLLYVRLVQPVFDRADEWILAEREFGFSSELYYGYGWALGLVIVYLLKYFKENKYFVIILPVVVFAILINARSGLIIAMIGLVVYVAYARKISLLIGISVIAVFITYLWPHLNFSWINSSTASFITEFWDQLISLSTGNVEETYLDKYQESHLVFPDNVIQWIFGRGYALMGNSHGAKSSDIGYLNDLAVGGLIYIGLVYVSYIKLIKLSVDKWLFVSMVLIMATINIKGQCLETNGLSRIVSLVCFYECLSKK